MARSFMQVEGSSDIHVVPPAQVAFELNNRFPMEEQGGLYFTMVYGVLDLKTLEFRYVSAGHPAVVHQSREGDPQLIEAADMAIGWMDDMEFEEHRLKLSAGDRLYLYSDGVPEAMDHDFQQFGDQRMINVISTAKSDPLDKGVASLLNAVEQWCVKNGPQDDVSILAMQLAD